jgi:hypothetical protein
MCNVSSSCSHLCFQSLWYTCVIGLPIKQTFVWSVSVAYVKVKLNCYQSITIHFHIKYMYVVYDIFCGSMIKNILCIKFKTMTRSSLQQIRSLTYLWEFEFYSHLVDYPVYYDGMFGSIKLIQHCHVY